MMENNIYWMNISSVLV